MPTPHGDIAVAADAARIRVTSPGGAGVLRFTSTKTPRSKAGAIRSLGGSRYELALDRAGDYVVDYKAADVGAH